MSRATVAPFAQGYAHPVDSQRSRRLVPYGPHDPSSGPTTVTIVCAGRYPMCGGQDHPRVGRHEIVLPVHPTALRLRMQVNTLAHHATTNQEDNLMADTYLSGYCNQTNPDTSHRLCPGTWQDKPCSCSRETCECYKRRELQQAVNTTVDKLQQVQQAGALPQTVEPDAVPTSWTAEEVADLMVELEQCPLCSVGWDGHTFTDDDRVVCT